MRPGQLGVLPTDTMKNTVYALAAAPIQSPEIRPTLASHFLDRNTKLRRVRVGSLCTPGIDDARSVHPARTGRRTARVVADREAQKWMRRRRHADPEVVALGVYRLHERRADDAARDDGPHPGDVADGAWRYGRAPVHFNDVWATVRATLLDAFARHDSKSVQHTLCDGRRRASAGGRGSASISSCRTSIISPIDLARLGLENRNEIFVPTDEPRVDQATIAR